MKSRQSGETAKRDAERDRGGMPRFFQKIGRQFSLDCRILKDSPQICKNEWIFEKRYDTFII